MRSRQCRQILGIIHRRVVDRRLRSIFRAGTVSRQQFIGINLLRRKFQIQFQWSIPQQRTSHTAQHSPRRQVGITRFQCKVFQLHDVGIKGALHIFNYILDREIWGDDHTAVYVQTASHIPLFQILGQCLIQFQVQIFLPEILLCNEIRNRTSRHLGTDHLPEQ